MPRFISRYGISRRVRDQPRQAGWHRAHPFPCHEPHGRRCCRRWPRDPCCGWSTHRWG